MLGKVTNMTNCIILRSDIVLKINYVKPLKGLLGGGEVFSFFKAKVVKLYKIIDLFQIYNCIYLYLYCGLKLFCSSLYL